MQKITTLQERWDTYTSKYIVPCVFSITHRDHAKKIDANGPVNKSEQVSKKATVDK